MNISNNKLKNENTYGVIDNLLPQPYFIEVQNIFNPEYFAWFFIDDMVYKPSPTENAVVEIVEYANMKQPAGFTHMFKDHEGNERSPFWPVVKPIADFACARLGFSYKKIIRCKANLLLPMPKYGKDDFSGPHIDHPDRDDFITLGFYPFDSDGDTFLFEETHYDGVPEKVTIKERISPMENRALFFDGWQYHSSSSPRKNNKRIFINFTLEI